MSAHFGSTYPKKTRMTYVGLDLVGIHWRDG